MAKTIVKAEYSLFIISGGLGKHILATAVAKAIKEEYPKRDLIVACAYPEIFLELECVSRVYKHGIMPYFYDDYIKDKNTLIFGNEPYHTTGHVNKKTNLVKTWCEMYGLKKTNLTPELVFNRRQGERSYEIWHREKPVLILQTNGGLMDKGGYSWTRDMPPKTAMEIIHAHKRDYHIIQICNHQNQVIPLADESIYQPMSNMELLLCLLHSSKRILIDSCLQHASHALKLKSVVLWVATSPDVFGYESQTNIVADLKDKNHIDSFLFDYDFLGHAHDYPQKTEEISFPLEMICPEYFKTEESDNGVQSIAPSKVVTKEAVKKEEAL